MAGLTPDKESSCQRLTDSTTTIPTRRTLLAGAPAVAAGALAAGTVANAMVVAMGKAAEVDPVLDVIERHRVALEIQSEAHKHFSEMDAQ
jgi:hypothetical protein